MLPRIPRFMVWCGTRRTEDWHLRYRASVVVSGHLHIPCTRYVDGVRFEEVSLGYPEQWKRREAQRGWRLEDHLRQILPTPEQDAGDPIRDWLERLAREDVDHRCPDPRADGRAPGRRRGPSPLRRPASEGLRERSRDSPAGLLEESGDPGDGLARATR